MVLFVGDEIYKQVTVKTKGKSTVSSVEISEEILNSKGFFKATSPEPAPNLNYEHVWQEPFIVL